MRRWVLPAAALLSLSGAFLAADRLLRDSSPTFDEPVHLAAGYTDLVHGRYRLNAMDHPPLAEMWAALPLLALRPRWFPSHPDWLSARLYHYGEVFLYQNRVPAARLLRWARTWNLLTLTLLLAAALLLWARRLDGEPALWGAAGALALCVPWATNAALITTDALSAALFFACCAALAGARSSASWAAAGAALGAALASKFNMIALPGLAGMALLAESRADRSRRPSPASLALAAAAALLVLALVYRFAFLPLYAKGLAATLERLAQGRSAFLLGRHSLEGWWWYFPAALLVKTPLPLLGLGLWGGWLALKRPRAESAWLLIPPAGYFLAALSSKTQIGYRHLLPVYPFLCLWAGLASARLWRAGGAGRAALGALALWGALCIVSARPGPLAYFNELARGRGHEWLADSNLDWGQDLPALARELAKRGNPAVVLSYFGSGDPAAYGIRYVPLAFVSLVERPGNAALERGAPLWLAVSQTNLAGVYHRDKTLFAWLRSRRPAAVPGGSIFLYDLTEDAEGRRLLSLLLRMTGRAGDADAAMIHSPRGK